jgi:hypothetical protein
MNNTQEKTKTATYCVFTRTWWKEATSAGWPNNLEPQAGTRSYRGHPKGLTYSEAREYCQDWNDSHDPGRYSRKAEFESE